ncbi:MAG: sigma-54-dependent Fis family transcriptional regulator [Ignavibacteriae bacterium]|nr:sigma-54-dependent Fis family transcriptional regulator [Ignavibacteriota bacterium]
MNLESLLIGESSTIKRLRKEIPKLGRSQKHLLIKGEPGTGKASLAKLIHQASNSRGSLVVLSPQAVSEQEINQSFDQSTKGASRVLIQNIEEFSYLAQSAIQSSIEKLPKKPFVQVIVTTKGNLGELQREGKIMPELYQLLKDFETIVMPPLRQRVEDISLLIEHFTKVACQSLGVKLKLIDINTLDFLVRREWKENIQELKSVVEQAVFMSEGKEIELPEYLYDEQTLVGEMMASIRARRAFRFDKSLANLEKTLIERTLDSVGFNQVRAAEILNLSEANFRYRLKKFKIQQKTERLKPSTGSKS